MFVIKDLEMKVWSWTCQYRI